MTKAASKLLGFNLRVAKACVLLLIVLLLKSLLSSNKAMAIGYSMNEDSIVELQIAKDAPTRINIVDEKITDIFVHPQEAAEVVIHSSGYLFVLPQAGKDRVYITVIGEHGTVQDLVLRCLAKSPSPIRLIKFKLNNEINNQQQVKND